VTHKGAPDYPRSQGHRYVADYIIEDSLLSLINFPIETIKNNKTIVTTGKKYNKLGSVDFDSPSQKSLIIDRDYRYLEETTLTLEDEYSTPTVVTKERDDGKIRFEVDDQVIDVSPGEERKIEISDQKINVLERNENGDTKVVRESVTPILNVFNHGLVDIYGSRNNAIVPADTRDPFGRSIVDYFEKASNLNIPDGPSFVVIPNEVLK